MKKALFIALIVLTVSGTSLFSLAVGGAWTFGVSNGDVGGGSAVFLLSHDSIPGTMLGLSFAANDGMTSIEIYDDWWLYKKSLGGPFHLALGPGFYVGGTFTDDANTFDLGGRVAVDLRAFVLDPLEFFFEWAPMVGVSGLGGSSDTVSFPNWTFNRIALGFRFWF